MLCHYRHLHPNHQHHLHHFHNRHHHHIQNGTMITNPYHHHTSSGNESAKIWSSNEEKQTIYFLLNVTAAENHITRKHNF